MQLESKDKDKELEDGNKVKQIALDITDYYSFEKNFANWFSHFKGDISKKIEEFEQDVNNIIPLDYNDLQDKLKQRVKDMQDSCGEFLNSCLNVQKAKLNKSAADNSLLSDTEEALNNGMEGKISQVFKNRDYLLYKEYCQLMDYLNQQIIHNIGYNNENNKMEDENKDVTYAKRLEKIKESLKERIRNENYKGAIKSTIENSLSKCINI